MSTATWVLLGLAGLLAICDWIAVGLDRRRFEYVFKPATMVPLIMAAATLEAARTGEQGWFVAALVLSLAGDVFLMLPDQERYFVPGLASFLVSHLAYITGMWSGGVETTPMLIALAVIAVAVAVGGPFVVRGAMRVDRRLGGPVIAYVAVVSAMVVSAAGTTVTAAIVGAVLFYVSDFVIGWSRFVKDFSGSRLVIITTYHVAQGLLVLSLATS